MKGYVEITPELPRPGDIMLMLYGNGALKVWRLRITRDDDHAVMLVQTQGGRVVDAWVCGKHALLVHLQSSPERWRLLRRKAQ